MTNLSILQKNILSRLFAENDSEDWINRIEECSLSVDEIEYACDVISNEFHMEGIDENFEANNYGKELERLLDVVNYPRLR